MIGRACGGRVGPAPLVAVLLVLTVAAYLPVWRNGFVDFDDALYVTDNPQVRRGLTGEVLRRIEAKGYVIVALELRTATRDLLERHYAEHVGKPFYEPRVAFMSSGPIVAGDNSAKCVDNNNGSGANGNKVQMWDCDGYAPAQNWTVNSNGTLTIDGGCMDITGANFNNGTLVELWTCNGGSNQKWTLS